MHDTEGAVLDAAPDAPPELPARPVFDDTQPRLLEPVTILLDRERPLRLPFKALRLFEKITSKNPWNPDLLYAVPPNLDDVTALLWVALLDDDPDLTREQLEDLPGMEFGNVHYIRRCLEKCWGVNMPPPDAKEPNGTAPKGSRPRG